MLPSLTFTLHVVMVTNLRHFVYLMDVNVHVKFQLDTTTRTYFLGGGHNVPPPPPPWFLEHQKSLVWIGLISTDFSSSRRLKVGLRTQRAKS